jgi:hypothetical protein
MRYTVALALTLLFGAQRTATGGTPDRPPPIVLLAREARDSMSIVFRRFNEHWDELGELNTLERMLSTVRPTQREYLGCLQGSVRGDTLRIERWQPAAEMKQLQLAVAGNCDTVSHLLGTWHTHPYRADPQNLPIKERSLSAQDLETFRGAPGLRVTLVMWDVDSLDAAVKDGQDVVHPAALTLSQ